AGLSHSDVIRSGQGELHRLVRNRCGDQVFSLNKRASDRFGEAETLKRGQPKTFSIGDSGACRWNTATLTAGDSDIPRGLGCRFVNRKAETVCRKNRETGTTGFRSSTFGFVHAAIAIGKADHPLALEYEAIRDVFQAKSLFLLAHPAPVSAASPRPATPKTWAGVAPRLRHRNSYLGGTGAKS